MNDHAYIISFCTDEMFSTAHLGELYKSPYALAEPRGIILENIQQPLIDKVLAHILKETKFQRPMGLGSWRLQDKNDTRWTWVWNDGMNDKIWAVIRKVQVIR